MLRKKMTQNRTWLIVRGIVAIAFGVLAILWPGPTLLALVILVGAYGLADGVSALMLMLRGERVRPADDWLMILSAIAGIGAGVITFLWPAVTAIALLIVFAVWQIVRGILEGAAAIRLRGQTKGSVLLAVTGALSVVVGIWLIAQPAVGMIVLVWLVAVYAIVLGILYISLGIRMRGVGESFMPAHF